MGVLEYKTGKLISVAIKHRSSDPQQQLIRRSHLLAPFVRRKPRSMSDIEIFHQLTNR
jgi:hypothetical protein